MPHLVKQKWPALGRELAQLAQLNPYHNRLLRLGLTDEAAAAPLLEQLAEEAGAEVAVGSYPVGSPAASPACLAWQAIAARASPA